MGRGWLGVVPADQVPAPPMAHGTWKWGVLPTLHRTAPFPLRGFGRGRTGTWKCGGPYPAPHRSVPRCGGLGRGRRRRVGGMGVPEGGLWNRPRTARSPALGLRRDVECGGVRSAGQRASPPTGQRIDRVGGGGPRARCRVPCFPRSRVAATGRALGSPRGTPRGGKPQARLARGGESPRDRSGGRVAASRGPHHGRLAAGVGAWAPAGAGGGAAWRPGGRSSRPQCTSVRTSLNLAAVHGVVPYTRKISGGLPPAPRQTPPRGGKGAQRHRSAHTHTHNVPL